MLTAAEGRGEATESSSVHRRLLQLRLRRTPEAACPGSRRRDPATRTELTWCRFQGWVAEPGGNLRILRQGGYSGQIGSGGVQNSFGAPLGETDGSDLLMVQPEEIRTGDELGSK